MGYFSDVAIVMKEAADATFRKACELVAASPQACFKSPFDQAADQRIQFKGDVLYVWKSVKAYDWNQIMSVFRENLDEALEEGAPWRRFFRAAPRRTAMWP